MTQKGADLLVCVKEAPKNREKAIPSPQAASAALEAPVALRGQAPGPRRSTPRSPGEIVLVAEVKRETLGSDGGGTDEGRGSVEANIRERNRDVADGMRGRFAFQRAPFPVLAEVEDGLGRRLDPITPGLGDRCRSGRESGTPSFGPCRSYPDVSACVARTKATQNRAITGPISGRESSSRNGCTKQPQRQEATSCPFQVVGLLGRGIWISGGDGEGVGSP